jgi:hypothetical protein
MLDNNKTSIRVNRKEKRDKVSIYSHIHISSYPPLNGDSSRRRWQERCLLILQYLKKIKIISNKDRTNTCG